MGTAFAHGFPTNVTKQKSGGAASSKPMPARSSGKFVWPVSARAELMTKQIGTHWEIAVNGKPRSYRNDKATALADGRRLKRSNPNVVVTVRDLESGETMVIENPPRMPKADV